jgi:hypothetical protein
MITLIGISDRRSVVAAADKNYIIKEYRVKAKLVGVVGGMVFPRALPTT